MRGTDETTEDANIDGQIHQSQNYSDTPEDYVFHLLGQGPTTKMKTAEAMTRIGGSDVNHAEELDLTQEEQLEPLPMFDVLVLADTVLSTLTESLRSEAGTHTHHSGDHRPSDIDVADTITMTAKKRKIWDTHRVLRPFDHPPWDTWMAAILRVNVIDHLRNEAKAAVQGHERKKSSKRSVGR
jgi:hypothetical protein